MRNGKTKNPLTAAFLWDESFLWGLMAYKALINANLPFDLIRSGDIKDGKLGQYRMLFVPGGWASNKIKTLGDSGVEEIRKFVSGGGSYLGFCGGAGLATLDGIGLLNISRKPSKERVPSFSGRIRLRTNAHPVWNGISGDNAIFQAWWPSQFMLQDNTAKPLAAYGPALPDSFSSDLNTGDVAGQWEELEKLYQIRLDPARLLNDPAVAEGTFGKGKVLLSLVHFDTPGDPDGPLVLRNLWEYLGGASASGSGNLKSQISDFKLSELPSDLPVFRSVSELQSAVEELIDLGIRNFLWFWRNPMLLQWRRGVRGLEYCTLYIMIKEIAKIIGNRKTDPRIKAGLDEIQSLLIPFTEKAKRLLIMERLAMQNGHITYEKCDDPEIQKVRNELFSSSKSYGGMFKELIDKADSLLYSLID